MMDEHVINFMEKKSPTAEKHSGSGFDSEDEDVCRAGGSEQTESVIKWFNAEQKVLRDDGKFCPVEVDENEE